MTKLRIKTTPTFDKVTKKLHADAKKKVDEAVHQIAAKPLIGELKKGDLSGVQVYKFRIKKQELLLSYTVGHDDILLVALGSHENFYRDLKR